MDITNLSSFYWLFRNYLCNNGLLMELPLGVKELRHISAKYNHINIQYF